MKKLFLPFFALLISVISVFAQQNEAPIDGPKLMLDVEHVDYGKIERGSNPYRKVIIKNVGNKPLTIESAKSNCGCLIPKVYDGINILPGRTTEMQLRYDTLRVGPFTKVVTLVTNEKVGEYMLKVKGHVVSSQNPDDMTPILTNPDN
ncbi:MAG: DUF1573 domain-containing protein [Bacteroidetes Order II. Incertae sedis bacterium]|nr:DUF1573 domain-containing protein [Bacteroidetes Order II. bacterium]